jgi:catechol 2,3-dioxygenase-like lactoylglutathione lyase family enzyme
MAIGIYFIKLIKYEETRGIVRQLTFYKKSIESVRVINLYLKLLAQSVNPIQMGYALRMEEIDNAMGVRHVGIVVSNLQESINFYKEIGFTLENVSSESGIGISKVLGIDGVRINTAKLHMFHDEKSMWREGGFRIELVEYSLPNSQDVNFQNNIIGRMHLCFTVGDLLQTLNRISVKFNLPITAPQFHDGNLMAYVNDLNGVAIELIQKK